MQEMKGILGEKPTDEFKVKMILDVNLNKSYTTLSLEVLKYSVDSVAFVHAVFLQDD